jgi:hypothetical protein
VQCRDRLVDEAVQKRIVQHVDMKMQHIELRSESPHFFEHHDVRRDRIPDARVEPEGDLGARLKPRGRTTLL